MTERKLLLKLEAWILRRRLKKAGIHKKVQDAVITYYLEPPK